MKLTDLHPFWWAAEGRHGQGIVFDCPCCTSKPLEQRIRLAIAFDRPLDGGEVFPIGKLGWLYRILLWNVGDATHPPIAPPGVWWGREGETFETLTIKPSVDFSAAGHWHGFITNGEVR